MKIWIVGAKGLLGSSLSSLCSRRHLPFLATGKEEAPVTCLEKLKQFVERAKPTHIVNCAAYTDVDKAEKESSSAFAVNALGAQNLGTVAREWGAKLVHISTDYVFSGSLKSTPFVETDTCHPVGVYAESKWEGEKRLLEEMAQACILRTSWLFGTQGNNFISRLLGMLHSQEQIKAVNDQTSRATFCFDLAETILSLLCHSGIFHFANVGELSRYQIARDMQEKTQQRGFRIACKEIVPVGGGEFPAAAKRPSYSVLCTRKIEGVLGGPPRSWNTVLEEFIGHAVIHSRTQKMEFQHSRRHIVEPGEAGVEAAPVKHRGDADGFNDRDAGVVENQFLSSDVYK